MTGNNYVQREVIAELLKELIFAVIIPVLFLWYFHNDSNATNHKNFMFSHDWGIATVILYGLSISKFYQADLKSRSAAFLGLIPAIFLVAEILTFFVIDGVAKGKWFYVWGNYKIHFSIVLMYLNFLISLFVFYVLGGWAIVNSKVENVKAG